MLNLMVIGATGKTGSRVCALIDAQLDCRLVSAIHSQSESPNLSEIDVIIDFSTPEGMLRAIEWSIEAKIPLLEGTTGYHDEIKAKLDALAEQVPVMLASNTSVGIQILRKALEKMVHHLGAGWDCDIRETHHATKKDAPSGTAISLQNDVLKLGADRDITSSIHSIRAGGAPAEHVVQFTNQQEKLSISHAALNRDVYAIGAIQAARWLSSQPAGLYSMASMLNQGHR